MPRSKRSSATPDAAPGRAGEDIAAACLLKAGLSIRAQRYRNEIGEVDIIAEEGEALVFVEVKSRTEGTAGGEPWEKVTPSKLRKICRAGQAYAESEGLAHRPLRVDVVGVWFENERQRVVHYRDVTRFASPPRR